MTAQFFLLLPFASKASPIPFSSFLQVLIIPALFSFILLLIAFILPFFLPCLLSFATLFRIDFIKYFIYLDQEAISP